MIRCRECGELCRDHDDRDECERRDQTKAAVATARADGAAAERARLVAVVRGLLVRCPVTEISGVRMALRAMSIEEGGDD